MAKASAVDNILEFDLAAIAAKEAQVQKETDEEILERMAANFQVLTDMTQAVKDGNVKAMIISGPPGIGKSHGVESVLKTEDLFNVLGSRKPKYEIIKGNMSALGLYKKLYEYKGNENVLFFDDIDNLFFDEVALNLLKAALDSNEKRTISWNTDSRALRNDDIPNSFDFCGAVVFATNIKFAHVRSKKLRAHLDALESRCHYIDLELDTKREKLLRIRQVVGEGMLDRYEFSDDDIAEILDYIETNADKMRELSLRMVLKTSDLKKSFPNSWETMGRTTLMKKGVK